jgi:hypothetical protein
LDFGGRDIVRRLYRQRCLPVSRVGAEALLKLIYKLRVNKKVHGAFARDKHNPTPLVFVVCEPKVPAEEWGTFCNAIEKSIQRR